MALVAAKCPHCGAGMRLSPSDAVVTCLYCAKSSFVPAHAERGAVAPPATAIIHVRAPASRALPAVWAIAAALFVLGSAAYAFLGARRAPGTSENYILHPTAAAKKLREKFEKYDIEQLIVYPTTIQICVTALDNPEHHDLYVLSSGGIDAGHPNNGQCTPRHVGSEHRTVAQDAFKLSEIDLELLPKIAADARGRTSVENGTLSHVMIGRSGFEAIKELILSLYVSGARSNQGLDYDLEGNFIDNLGQYNKPGIGPHPWRDQGGAAASSGASAAPSEVPAHRARLGLVTADGSLPKTVVQSVLSKQTSASEHCLAGAPVSDGTRVALVLVVGPDGRVISATPQGTAPDAVTACVVALGRELTFPRAAGATRVTWSVLFTR